MFKRIILFLAVNVLVVLTISLTLNLLGVRPYLSAQGIDYNSLLIFCAVWGFMGAFISLALSRVMAKFAMGVRVIDPQTASGPERELVRTVHRLAQKAGLTVMPQVGYYESPEINAFATGPSKSRSLVAVSSGLLQRMDGAAVEGVLGHEIAHIANGDMVTMTLVQGVVNTFVMFIARVAGWAISNALAGNRDENRGANPFVHMMVVFVLEIILSFLGMLVVAYFSRRREFRADHGGAQLAGREKMIHALESLKRGADMIDTSHASVATLKINGARGFMKLFSTHPDLDLRISKLRSGTL